MYRGFINEVTTILVESGTTGLTDVEVIVNKPDGSLVAANVALAEVGGSKVYKGTFTPLVEGTYIFTIDSPTDAQIDGKKSYLVSKPVSKSDIGGSGYDSSTDSLKILSDKIDIITTNQSDSKNGFLA